MADRASIFGAGVRTLVPELMDDPALERGEHERALRGLSRLNAASIADRPVWRVLRSCLSPGERLSILDVATGGGDVPARIHARGEKAGIGGLLDWSVCDASERAVEIAQHRLHAARATGFTHDIVRDPLARRYDVVLCSLFLHHLSAQDAVRALRHMAEAAGCCLIVSDLRRSVGGLALAAFASRVLSRSRVVHTDAVLSARAAWTVEEARLLAHEAGLSGAVVQACRPSRWLLVWRRP